VQVLNQLAVPLGHQPHGLRAGVRARVDVLRAVCRAQADALEIEARAKRRLVCRRSAAELGIDHNIVAKAWASTEEIGGDGKQRVHRMRPTVSPRAGAGEPTRTAARRAFVDCLPRNDKARRGRSRAA
jgi:hypothetical protein